MRNSLTRVLAGAMLPLTAVVALAAAPASSAAPAPAKSYTMAQVAKHNTATDCWTVVNKKVYNVTGWVNKHPGGSRVITAMCGRDGTAMFRGEHGTSGKPSSVLAAYQIGVLK